MSVARFFEVTGVQRATWYLWWAAGAAFKGPWATPAQDVVEADATALAGGVGEMRHGKLAELKRVGVDRIATGAVSDSTMYRALSRSSLCLPANYAAGSKNTAGEVSPNCDDS